MGARRGTTTPSPVSPNSQMTHGGIVTLVIVLGFVFGALVVVLIALLVIRCRRRAPSEQQTEVEMAAASSETRGIHSRSGQGNKQFARGSRKKSKRSFDNPAGSPTNNNSGSVPDSRLGYSTGNCPPNGPNGEDNPVYDRPRNIPIPVDNNPMYDHPRNIPIPVDNPLYDHPRNIPIRVDDNPMYDHPRNIPIPVDDNPLYDHPRSIPTPVDHNPMYDHPRNIPNPVDDNPVYENLQEYASAVDELCMNGWSPSTKDHVEDTTGTRSTSDQTPDLTRLHTTTRTAPRPSPRPSKARVFGKEAK